MSTRRRIFIGNLPGDVTSREVGDLFQKYGKILAVELIMTREDRRKPPFAFVEFEDPRSAEVAIRKRHRSKFGGSTINVQFSRDDDRRKGGGTGYGGSSSGDGIGRGSRVPRRSHYRVRVSGLPSGVFWQDLKDYVKGAQTGDVCFVDVFQNGTAIVEYSHYEDMKKAVDKLDSSKYPSKEGKPVKIRAREDFPSFGDTGRSSRGRDRPRSRSRGRSRSGSPVTRPTRSISPQVSHNCHSERDAILYDSYWDQ